MVPLPTEEGLYQEAGPEKEPKLARWSPVWTFTQVTPAPRREVLVLDTVISQLAWWVESGPHAGEKLTAAMATPLTAVQLAPKQPP